MVQTHREELMTGSIRAGVLAATGALALAFAGSALSAINPKLVVGTTSQAGNTKTSIEARVGSADDAVARIQVFVPTGFKLDSPAGGVDVGTVSATVQSKQIGPGTEIPFKLTGKLTAIGATDPAVAYESANCDGGASHAAAWIARLEGGGNSWTFAVFVDPTTGAEAQFGPYKLVACFKSVAGANADAYGNKFVSMSLAIDNLGAPTAAGTYVWRSLWTPFASDTNGSLNQAGSVEAQSSVKLPAGVLSLNGKKAGKAHIRVTLSGKLLVDAEPIGGATVAIRHGTKTTGLAAVGSVKTTAAGAFSKLLNLTRSQYFQVGTTIGGNDLGATACAASFGAAVPCVSATNGKVAVVSRLIHFAR
jgi:hypothetical protein